MATLEARLAALITAVGADIKSINTKVTTAFKNVSATLTGATDVIGSWTIQDDSTSTASWPDRLTVWFKNTSNVSRRTFYLNEYGEVRIAPGKPDTVPFRIFQKEQSGDPSRNMTVPLIEIFDDRTNRTSIYRVMPDGTVYVGDQCQRLVSWEEGDEPPDLSIFPDGTWYGVRPAP